MMSKNLKNKMTEKYSEYVWNVKEKNTHTLSKK